MSNSVADPGRSAAAEPLVPEWLGMARASRLSEPDLLVLDIRSVVDGGGRQAYEAGHIPGAIHTDYANDGWRVTKGMASGLLPDPAALADSAQPHRAHATPSCRHRLGRNDSRRLQRGRSRLLDAQDRRPRQDIHPLGRHAGLGPQCNAAARSRAGARQSAVTALSDQACAGASRRRRRGGTRDRRSNRGPARQPRHDLLRRRARNLRKPCGQGGFRARCSSIMSRPSIPRRWR